MLKVAVVLCIFVYLSNALGGHEHEYHDHEHEYPEHEGYHAGMPNQAYGGEYEHGEYEHEDHYNQGYNQNPAYNTGNTAMNSGYNNNYNQGTTGQNTMGQNPGMAPNNAMGQNTMGQNTMNQNTMGQNPNMLRVPKGDMVVHSPTTQGFSMVYDVSYPNRAGSFYYFVKEGTIKPALNDVKMGTGATCANRFPQVDDSMTTNIIPCTLQLNKSYMVWCATDSDSNGRDLAFCNLGAGELMNVNTAGTVPIPASGHGTIGHGTSPATGTGIAPGHGVNPNSPIPRYRLVLGGHTCDFEEKAMQFVKMLRVTSMNDIESCARAVAVDPECGQTFFGGGLGGTCGCVRKTAETTQNQQGMGSKFRACDEEESEMGDGIYTFTPANGIILQSRNAVPENTTTTSTQPGFGAYDMVFAIVTTFVLTVCCLASMYAAYQYGKKQQQTAVSDGAYSIYLDEEKK